MLITHDPMPVEIPKDMPMGARLRMFLGHYDLRFYVTETAYVDVGRGSFYAGNLIEFVVEEAHGSIGVVGQFCNFATPCHLYGGGEHRNELPVHTVEANIPFFDPISRAIPELRPREPDPFHIGNGVVISGRAQVLPGARIGDGALVAAGAVVAGQVEPFAISGGVPARHLRYRLDEATRAAVAQVRPWDFDLVYRGNNLHRLQELAVDTTAQHVYRKPSPRLVLRTSMTPNGLMAQALGFMDGDDMRPLSEAPARAQAYLQQISGPGPYYWLADMWL